MFIGRPVTVRLTGAIPGGAETFTWRASPGFGPVLLVLQQGGDGASVSQWLDAGDASEPFPLTVVTPEKGFVAVLVLYLGLGFTHIVPKGLDHILFVLGLFLLSTKLRPLLWQVTAFTVAHSVTLAMSMLGLLSLPPSVVEPLIALSIAWVAFENIVTSELKPWRPLVVFCFGLLHGLGFASVLVDLGMPRGHFVTALVGFNVGVELGQLAVIGFALAGVGWYWKARWYRPWVVIPVSGAIAAVGLYWAVERTLL
ncbi:MAG: HupE/UreJ family protein [Deltaproteobacteria bacterium]|nr:HupE/UreJ family protein [Deltaproteobacteria bacterium]MBW2254196.1 HupE/UreJ family protein [Deltaproteobacteria bacterium]